MERRRLSFDFKRNASKKKKKKNRNPSSSIPQTEDTIFEFCSRRLEEDPDAKSLFCEADGKQGVMCLAIFPIWIQYEDEVHRRLVTKFVPWKPSAETGKELEDGISNLGVEDRGF